MIPVSTFIVVAKLHLRALSETMKEVTSATALPTRDELAVQQQLRKQYSSLLVVTVLFSVTTISFETLLFFTMADASAIVKNGTSNEAASLMAREYDPCKRAGIELTGPKKCTYLQSLVSRSASYVCGFFIAWKGEHTCSRRATYSVAQGVGER